MVKTTNNGSNISPFLAKCYEMVEDESTDAIVSWSQSNDSFVIWDMTEFCVLLPKYFKHQNFSSFMRQLNIYGFRKIDTDRWEFANEGFIKGQKHLLRNIKRRKHPPQAPVQEQCPEEKETVVETVDYSSLQKEVEVLTADKKVLMQEFMKLREHQESAQNNLIALGERIQGMEKSQQQLLSFLVMVMQSPGFLAQLFQTKGETNWRMAESGKITLREGSTVNGEPMSSGDGMIVRYQPLSDEAWSPSQHLSPLPDSEPELSFDRVKELFTEVDTMPLPPIDEIYRSPENHQVPIMVPELDLSVIEQFLLDSPIRENEEHTEECLDEEEMEFESCLYGTQSEKSQPKLKHQALSVEDRICQKLDVLTEQMGQLSPGKTSNKGGRIF